MAFQARFTLTAEYAAGFFDGEGCVHIDRNLRAVIAGCFTPGLLESFCEKWGGSVTTCKSKRDNCRTVRRWEIVGPKAMKFLQDIQAHMIEKGSQVEIGIKYQLIKENLGVRGGKGYTVNQRAMFKSMEEEIKSLKKLDHTYEPGWNARSKAPQ